MSEANRIAPVMCTALTSVPDERMPRSTIDRVQPPGYPEQQLRTAAGTGNQLETLGLQVLAWCTINEKRVSKRAKQAAWQSTLWQSLLTTIIVYQMFCTVLKNSHQTDCEQMLELVHNNTFVACSPSGILAGSVFVSGWCATIMASLGHKINFRTQAQKTKQLRDTWSTWQCHFEMLSAHGWDVLTSSVYTYLLDQMEQSVNDNRTVNTKGLLGLLGLEDPDLVGLFDPEVDELVTQLQLASSEPGNLV